MDAEHYNRIIHTLEQITADLTGKWNKLSLEQQSGLRAALANLPEAGLALADPPIPVPEMTVFHDVSEKRAAGARLQLFSQLIDLSYEPIFSWELYGGIVTWNQGCTQLYGYTRDEALGRVSHDLLATHWPVSLEETQDQLRQYGSWTGQIRQRTKDGQILIIESRLQLIEIESRQLVLETIRDITWNVAAQEQARESAAEKEVHHRLLEQREQERMQIARDLHDGPVQALSAASFTLDSLMMEINNAEINQQLVAIRESLQEEIKGLRSYAGELRPPALARFGLAKGIRSHMETFHEKHPELAVQFIDDPQEGGLVPETQRVAIYRIYQEAMNNIAKHARATAVRIHLHKDRQLVLLEVDDNGQGFVPPADGLELIRQGHLGLAGMRERAEAAGGKLEITSTPGRGTSIRIEVPVVEESE